MRCACDSRGQVAEQAQSENAGNLKSDSRRCSFFLAGFSAGVQVSVPLCPLLRTRLGLGFADQVGVQVYVVEDGNAAKVGSGIGAFISYDVDFHDEICW